VSTTENIGRCPHCHKFMIAEESKTHVCDKSKSDVSIFSNRPLVGCEELVLHRLTDSGEEKNGDHVYLAWGISGILYRLLVCRHNPPHSAKRGFTGYGAKQGLDTPSRMSPTLPHGAVWASHA
jgi:hypothetical protein